MAFRIVRNCFRAENAAGVFVDYYRASNRHDREICSNVADERLFAARSTPVAKSRHDTPAR
jgi:hypothetical protein